MRTTTHDAGHIVTDKDRALAEAGRVDGRGLHVFNVFVCFMSDPVATPPCGRRGSMEL